MSTFDVRIGINPISWMNDDLPSLGGETPLEVALSEGAAIGYAGFELGNKFPKQSAALRAVLEPHKLACVSGWYSGRLADAGRTVEQEIEAVGPHLRLLAETGAPVMVYGEVADAIQGQPQALRRRPRFRDEAGWLAYGEKLNAFGAHLLRHGVRLAYHHHMGAYVEAPEDIDKLMSVTGPDVGLLFDTGHMLFGGADVLAMLDKHIARVCHVHCKDVRPAVTKMARNRDWSFLQSVLNGAFTVPGDGCIDFDAVLRRLARHGYRGWLVVEAEQDPAVAPSYQYAKMGYEHIRSIVDAINAEGA
ncbi:MAG: myo-inosose-2 dehydratase [Telluria sp.]